jgi:peptidoglycan/LPS O-acetylase OafA/YrhL
MTAPSNQPKYYFGAIDGLRALAVVAVLIFHLPMDLAPAGYLGVDIFFVISGFLITRQLTINLSIGLLGFYVRRFSRLAPMLFLVCAVTLVTASLTLKPEAFLAIRSSSIASILWFSNLHFWSQTGYFDSAVWEKPLLHTWSLSVEEQFYLVWPWVFIFAGTLTKAKRVVASYMIVLLLGLSSLVLSFFYREHHAETVFYWMPFRVWEFAVGALVTFGVAKGTKALVSPRQKTFALWVLFLLLCLLMFAPYDWRSLALQVLVVAFTATYVFLSDNVEAPSGLSDGVLKWLGDRSYAIYLWHWPLIYFLQLAIPNSKVLVSILAVALTFLAATVSFKYIERSVRPLGATTYRNGVALLICLVSTLVILMAGFFSSSELAGKQSPMRVEISTSEIEAEREEPLFRVLVLGDSHARVLVEGITARYAEKVAVSTYDMNGTFPGWMTRTYDDGRLRPFQISDATVEGLLTKKYDIAIVHARWGVYYYGNKLSLEGTQVKRVVSEGQLPASLSESRSVQSNGLAVLLKKLSGVADKVMVIGAVPPPGVEWAKCANRAKHTARCGPMDCSSASMRVAEVNAALAVWSEVAEFLDPTPLICGDGVAYPAGWGAGGLPLFMDSSHLSDSGKTWFAEQIFRGLSDFSIE